MIAYIKGVVEEVYDNLIVVENNGMGFNIFVPDGYAYSKMTEAKIYTYTNVKEDAFQLYGFETKDQLELFKKLITVNGIGPKGGLAILSVMTADDLRFAIYSEDAKAIAKAPGIGKKTAERVILDLKDKISLDEVESMPSALKETDGLVTIKDRDRKDAIEALTALGYGSSEAAKAVSKVEIVEGMSVEDILKKSLQFLF